MAKTKDLYEENLNSMMEQQELGEMIGGSIDQITDVLNNNNLTKNKYVLQTM